MLFENLAGLTAFKRREQHTVKSFTIDDVLKRSREEPTKKSKETSEFVEILSRQNFLDTKLILVVLVAKLTSFSKICHACRPTLQIEKMISSTGKYAESFC